MNLIASVILIVLGVALLLFGIQGADSFASEVKEVFDGTPTDKSIWLLVAGGLSLALGLFSLSRAKPKTS